MGLRWMEKIGQEKKCISSDLCTLKTETRTSFITTRRFVNSQNSPMKGRMRQNRTSFKRGLFHLKNSFFLYFWFLLYSFEFLVQWGLRVHDPVFPSKTHNTSLWSRGLFPKLLVIYVVLLQEVFSVSAS